MLRFRVLSFLLFLALPFRAQTVNPQALATVSAATFRIDKAELGWPNAMGMTPFPWVKHPTWPGSYHFNAFLADPEKGTVLTYQTMAGPEVMKALKDGSVNRENALAYITGNHHVKAKLSLGRDFADKGHPKLYEVTGSQGSMKTLGYAGYAKGYLVYFAMNWDPKTPLDPAWVSGIFFRWLDRFPNLEVAEVEPLAVEVLPSMQEKPSDVGLIPAAAQLPARIQVKGLAPNTPIAVSIAAGAPALLRTSGASSGSRSLSLKTDGTGRAEVFLYAQPTSAHTRPYSVKVHIQPEEGSALSATVHIGLALAFAEIAPVKGDHVNKTLAPYPLRLGVRSQAHPGLNLASYLERAEASGVWSGLTLGIDLKTEWLNQPEGSPDDKVYWGTTNVYFHSELGGKTILVANGEPSYRVQSFTYPAVILASGGEHIYRISAFPVVMRVSDKSYAPNFRQAQPSQEPWLAGERPVVLSGNDPDGWFNVFQAAACALEPTSTEQEIYLGLLKTFPPTAALTGEITEAAGIACSFAKGDYAAAFLDLAKTLGTKYIDRLADPEKFKTLTEREKKMVKAAKTLVDAVDASEKEAERDTLRVNLKKKFDEEMRALYGK